LSKCSVTATQAILYFDSFAPGDTVTVKFHLRAKYTIRARTFKSRVYEYYDPEVSSVARPAQTEVRKRLPAAAAAGKPRPFLISESRVNELRASAAALLPYPR